MAAVLDSAALVVSHCFLVMRMASVLWGKMFYFADCSREHAWCSLFLLQVLPKGDFADGLLEQPCRNSLMRMEAGQSHLFILELLVYQRRTLYPFIYLVPSVFSLIVWFTQVAISL